MAGWFDRQMAELQPQPIAQPRTRAGAAPMDPSVGPYRLPEVGTQTTQPMPVRTSADPNAGVMASGDEFAGLSPDDQQLARTLRQRYGPTFDLNDPERGLPYFKRRMAETAAEGDARPLDYWLMRASGVNEGQYAIDEAQRAGGGGTLGGMANGALLQPWGQTFSGANGTTILDSPAFKAAQKNATDAIQRSAAAKGTLLTGGTLKDLSDYQMGMGLGAINDQFNRDIGEAGFNRDTFWGDADRKFNRLYSFAGLGAQNAGTLGSYGSGYGTQTGQNARTSADLVTGQGDNEAQGALSRAAVNSGTLAGIVNAAGNIDWGKLFNRGTPGALARGQ